MTPNAPWLTNIAGRCPVGLLGCCGATTLPFGRPMPLKWPPHSTMAVPAGAGGFVAATAEEQQKAAPWGGLDPNSNRPLQLFRWAACSNLNAVPVFQQVKSHVPFERCSSRRLAPSRTQVFGKAAWGGLNLTRGAQAPPGVVSFQP